MRYIARTGKRQFTIALPETGRRQHVTFEGKELSVELNAVEASAEVMLEGNAEHAAHYGLIAGTRSHDVFVRPVPGEDDGSSAQTFEVSIAGRTFTVTLQDEHTQALIGLAAETHPAGDAVIRAPMPGLVSSVLAGEGTSVRRGQTIVVLEAMKMENDLTTPRAGVVKRLRVAQGQTVNQGDVLAIVGDLAGTTAHDKDESSA